MHITGAILAGGKSSRMGTNKALLELKGKTMIQHSIDAIESLCDELIISANTNEYSHLNYLVVEDEIKNIGPIGGLHSALKTSKEGLLLTVPCDTPFISSNTFIEIIEKLQDFDICFAHSKKGVEPLIAGYRTNILNKLESLVDQGLRKMQNLAKEFHAGFVEVNDQHLIKNFNTAEEFHEEKIQEHIARFGKWTECWQDNSHKKDC